jgi:hypothetical protein
MCVVRPLGHTSAVSAHCASDERDLQEVSLSATRFAQAELLTEAHSSLTDTPSRLSSTIASTLRLRSELVFILVRMTCR